MAVLALLLCSSALAKEQLTRADSLQRRIEHTRNDTMRARLMMELGRLYSETGRYDQGISMARDVLELCSKPAPNSKVRVTMRRISGQAHGLAGYVLQHKGDLPGALDRYTKAAHIHEVLNDEDKLNGMYQNIANVYEAQGNSLKAFEFYQKCLKYTLDHGNKKDIGYLYANMGIFFSHQGEYKKAQEHYEKALTYLVDLLPPSLMARFYGNIASNLRRMHEYDKALSVMHDAFQRVDPLKDSVSLSYCHYMLAEIYKEMSSNGQDELDIPAEELDEAYLDSAQVHFIRSMRIERAMGSDSWLVYDLTNLGRSALIHKRYDEAYAYLSEASVVADRMDALKMQVEAYRGLSMALEGMGRLGDAYRYQKLFMTAKDSLYDKEKTKELGRLEAKAEYDREAMRVAQERERADSLFQAQLEKQAIQRNSLVGGLAAVLLLAGVGYRNYQNKRRAYTEVQQQKALLEERNKDITDSIRYAKRIQEAVLSTDVLFRSTLPDSFVLYRPKDIVSGDFYWFERRAGRALLAVVDCTGHGVPGALMTIVASNGLTKAMSGSVNTSPAEILDRLNWYVNESMRRTYDKTFVRDGMDIALCVIDLEEQRLRFAGANLPLLMVRNNVITELKGDKHPVGVFIGETLKPFTEHELQLEENDRIYLFTDGIIDQFGGDQGKKFRPARLKDLILAVQHGNMAEQRRWINDAFNTWKGEQEQVDDMCMVGFSMPAPRT